MRKGTTVSSPPQEPSREPLRIDVLVDGGNWYHALRQHSAGGRKYVNYRALAEWLVGELQKEGSLFARRSVQIGKWYFTAVPEDDPLFKASMLAFLSGIADRDGYHVVQFPKRISRVSCVECGKQQVRFEEEQVDVAVATQLILRAVEKVVDAVVLVSGDSDYVPAVMAAQEMGMPVFVAGFPGVNLAERLVAIP